MATAPHNQAYCEIMVAVPSDAVDLLSDFIVDNITGGLVLEEEEDSASTAVRFYVPLADAQTAASRLLAHLNDNPNTSDRTWSEQGLHQRTIHQADWEEAYRLAVTPARIGEEIMVRPPWFEPVEGIQHDIVVEPKMAFGTGKHETTRSCLLAVRKYFEPGSRFLDLGCGSGVLAILADQIGATFLRAIDYDQLAVDNCHENFTLNRVRADHDIAHGSIELCKGDEPYEFVCANIITETIVSMAGALFDATKPGGYLVVSGILDKYEPQIHEAMKAHPLQLIEVLADEEWRTCVFRRGEEG